MNIIDKLKTQHEFGGIILFKEGLFLRAYNESCYILTQRLRQDLKTKCYQVKRYNKIWVVECAFPYPQLSKRLPNAQLLEFGARESSDFDLKGYHNWFELNCRHANEVSKATNARVEELKAPEQWALDGLMQNNDDIDQSMVPLNSRQITFLSNWQRGIHSVDVDLDFIEDLKSTLKANLFI